MARLALGTDFHSHLRIGGTWAVVRELELYEERNPANPDRHVAEATLHLKGVTLRSRDASPDIMHSINLCAEELSVQVKRHRDKRRKRREAHASATQYKAARAAL